MNKMHFRNNSRMTAISLKPSDSLGRTRLMECITMGAAVEPKLVIVHLTHGPLSSVIMWLPFKETFKPPVRSHSNCRVSFFATYGDH